MAQPQLFPDLGFLPSKLSNSWKRKHKQHSIHSCSQPLCHGAGLPESGYTSGSSSEKDILWAGSMPLTVSTAPNLQLSSRQSLLPTYLKYSLLPWTKNVMHYPGTAPSPNSRSQNPRITSEGWASQSLLSPDINYVSFGSLENPSDYMAICKINGKLSSHSKYTRVSNETQGRKREKTIATPV